MGKSCKYLRLDHNSSPPTSFSATSIGDGYWVKGFFLMVPHEGYETPTSPFDDDMNRAPHYLHLQQNIFFPCDDTYLHGHTYDVHLSHLKTRDFPCSLLSSIDVGETSFTTWMKEYKANCFDASYIFL